MNTKLRYVFSITLFLLVFSAYSQKEYWVAENFAEGTHGISMRNLDNNNYKVFKLNITDFKQQLIGTPLRGQFSGRSNTIISIPNEKGTFETFRVIETPVLSEELSQRHPEIKTYLGFGVDNPGARARFSVTPMGVKTMVSYVDKPTVFSNPISSDARTTNLFYTREAQIGADKSFKCTTEEDNIFTNRNNSASRDANDKTLRTFRIAISTTGEYTDYWGDDDNGNGTNQDDALAKVVSTLNRTNDVFEVDMAITFTLVSGTSIIYPDASSDPYPLSNLNAEVQSVLTTNIGEANYDIGHLLHKEATAANNNGNAGCIGCVCVDNQKGSGFSSHAFTDNDGGPYMDDFFDIDYVPHEIGHQMGSLHTHSDADNNSFNFEPGSGTTIMGYAGITGANDVQDHSDPYFHYGSILQILGNTNVSSGCAVTSSISNNPPVSNAGSDHSIPQGTAFILKGSATDPDGSDVLSYSWEQIDDAVTQIQASNFGPTITAGPLWRSRPPNASPDRYMPVLSRVLSGQLTETNPAETVNNTSWETVSTVARTLNFALTVRDRSEAGGTGQTPQSSYDTMAVDVVATTTPFSVISQATSGISWTQNTNETITWDVAGTMAAPISTANVNILLSTDGGLTYPIVLANNTPNDGSEVITVPNVAEPYCRIKVEAIGNIFYALNSKAFAIGYIVTTTCNQYDSVDPNLPLSITDDGSAYTETSTLNVTETTTITDINVGINITHPYVGDLQVGVQSPQGTLLNLMAPYSPCQGEDNLIVKFDDGGDPFACNLAGGNLILQSPQDLLSGWNGEDPSGTWTFLVGDFGPADVGTLNSWYIEVCTTELVLSTVDFENLVDFSLTPNPNNGEFTVKLNSNSQNDINIGVYDISGRHIFNESYSSSANFSQTVNIRNVSSGLYMVSVSDGDRRATKKIIIE